MQIVCDNNLAIRLNVDIIHWQISIYLRLVDWDIIYPK